MNLKNIFAVFLVVISVICISGCTTFNPTTEATDFQEKYDYAETLASGLKVNISKKSLDKDLMGICFSMDYDNGEVIVDKDKMQTDFSSCYLTGKNDDKIVKSSGYAFMSDNILYFDNVKLSDYILHFDCPIIIKPDSPYRVAININELKKEQYNK